MARRLTEKEINKIVADYITTQNYSETSRINNVNEKTVRRIIKEQNHDEMKEKAEQKKEEDTKDILEYMNSIKEKQKRIIDLSLQALEDKLESPDMFTNVKDIATVYGVIFDKALKYKEIQLRDKEDNIVAKQNGVIDELIGALNKAKENK